MAASAAEAQALAQVWKIKPGGSALSDEAKLFIGWQAEFDKRCRSNGWIDPAGLQRHVIELIAAGHFALPEKQNLNSNRKIGRASCRERV